MQLQPFYVIPVLIKQPTWGGSYIAERKQLLDPVVRQQRIGQSYELSSESRVSTDPAAQDCFILTDSGLRDAQHYGPLIDSYDLQSIIALDPGKVCGAGYRAETMLPLLIKLNQARSNSYQVHVKPGSEFHGWLAKPETWYFLEAGKVTLGIKQGTNLAEYKRACTEIDEYAQRLHRDIKEGILTVPDARQQLTTFIEQRHPERFVNTVSTPKGAVADLWQGGTHHSWETEPESPTGNIIYEVQINVKDERSTIRSFDQGNIKDNGDIRPVHVEDYFQALDLSPKANNPQQLLSQPQGHMEGSLRTTVLSSTPFYELRRLDFSAIGSIVQKTRTMHHLYLHDGEATVEWRDQQFVLKQGRSLFIPACAESYVLSTTSEAIVLQTTLPEEPDNQL